MRILFMGSGDVACPALERLARAPDWEVISVIAQPDRPKGRNRRLCACPAKELAEQHDVPVLTPEKVGKPESITTIEALRPDIIVVAAYGQYITPRILQIPPLGAINIHPSLLPKYRGASPIQWAVANGDTETGVTILYVSEEMDAGDIILQRSVPIDPEDNTLTLTPRLAELGADLLVDALKRISAGTAVRQPQDEKAVTTVYKLEKEDGRIDWQLPASVIHNRIRGFTPWPGGFTETRKGVLKVWKTEPVEDESDAAPGTVIACDGGGPVIATGSGALRLLEVQPEGKKVMSGKAYLCGHAWQPGDSLL